MPSLIPNYPYHQSLVYKVMLADKPRGMVCDLEQTLALIGQVHHFSRGMPQIVYLVGWQYGGHDSKYPAWFEVNSGLRRPQDINARQSLLWLFREAQARFNAVLSVHVNMDDAYENSPLWDDYVREGLIQRGANGELQKGGVWGGEQCYLISKTQEWRGGWAKKRLDALLELLPIEEAGTLHIDVFQPRPDPVNGITLGDDVATMKEILRYLKSRGVDVTKEWFDHEFVGYVPMVWHFNLDEVSRIQYPASLICGGGSAWNRRGQRGRIHDPEWMMPETGCLYEEAWGHSIDQEPWQDGHDLSHYAEMFYLRTLPWHFLNQYRARRYIHDARQYEVQFSDDVRTTVRHADRNFILEQGGRTLMQNTDVCLPLSWRPAECLAYSKQGGDKSWELPEEWEKFSRIYAQPLAAPLDAGRDAAALQPQPGSIELTPRCGKVRLEMEPGRAVVVSPFPIQSVDSNTSWLTQ